MTDKIKFCPQCNSCLFDDMMTCCVCGYQFTCEEDDPVPLSAYDEVGGWELVEGDVQTEGDVSQEVRPCSTGKGEAMSVSIDCGNCFIDISVRPK